MLISVVTQTLRDVSSVTVSFDWEGELTKNTLAGFKSSICSLSTFWTLPLTAAVTWPHKQSYFNATDLGLAYNGKTTQLITFVCLVHFVWLLMSHSQALASACWDRFGRNRNVETPWQNCDCYLSWHGEADSFTSCNQILWFWLLGYERISVTVKLLYIVFNHGVFSLDEHWFIQFAKTP